MRLVLFDIDGTMLSSGRGPKRAFNRAVKEVCGITVELTYEIAAGGTDPGILRYVLSRAGMPDRDIEAVTPRVFDRHLSILRDIYNANNDAYLFAGVPELLQRLDTHPDVTLGLLTGNIEEGARIKLGPFDVNHYFPFGAYGSDDIDRDRLPAIAVRRAEESTGHSFGAGDVVIVGDTVKDIQCARAIDARSVIVLRHPAQREPVLQAQPEALVDDFEDTDTMERLILS